jgi:phosphoglycerol transferase MdoB-like AlkP superfamily enzyme
LLIRELLHMFKTIRFLSIRFLIALIIAFFCRLIFMLLNLRYFADNNLQDITWAFISGIRFDTTAIVYLLIPFWLVALASVSEKYEKTKVRTANIFYITGVSFFILLNFIDTAYFSFSNKRSGWELWHIQKELIELAWDYLFDFWYLFLLLITAVFILIYITTRNQIPILINSRVKWYELLISILLLGFFARGTVGLKPLNILDAARLANPSLASLTLNTPFQMIMTIGETKPEEFLYFNKNIADKIFSPLHVNNAIQPPSETKNVVVIVLESFGKEHIGFLNNGKGYTPFLDSLSELSIVYEHAYANGKRSIEGIPAILASIPSLMEKDFLSSTYAINTIHGIGNYLLPLGYDVSFYHGGKNGTMGFNNFIARMGGKYFGMDEFPESEKYFDGNWGIPDLPYFSYVATEINHKKKPFFTTVFSLSSHHPYQLPKTEKIPPGIHQTTHPIQPLIFYTDNALRVFFDKIKNEPWFQNTIFIITADHSSENLSPYYCTVAGRFEIPLLIYGRNVTPYRDTITTVQQVDIMNIVMDMLDIRKYFSFGNGYYSNNHFAVQRCDQLFQIIEWPYIYRFNGKVGVDLYNIATDSLLRHNLINEEGFITNKLDTLLKTYLQQFSYYQSSNQAYIK